MKSRLFCSLVLFTSTAFVSCGSSDDGTEVNINITNPVAPTVPKLDSIYLSPSSLVLKVGESSFIFAHILPQSLSQNVSWRSSDTTIASISTSGQVVAKRPGQAVVTTKWLPDTSKFATASVTVSAPTVSTSLVKEIIFTGDSVITLKAGTTRQMIQPRCTMADATKTCTLIWASSNAAILMVNQNTGSLSGIVVGQAIVSVKVKEDTLFKATYPHPVVVVP